MKALLRLQYENLKLMTNFFFRKSAHEYKSRTAKNPQFNIVNRNTAFYDMELNFLIRVILEGRYECVLEIGAFRGNRAADLKRLLPSIEIVACDLMYLPATDGPVTTLPFGELSSFRSEKRTLFFCVATFAAMTEDELANVILLASQRNADLAFVEPDLRSGVERTTLRTPISYFHNYKRILDAHGYRLIAQNDTRQKTHLDLLQCLKGNAPEVWRPHYAVREN